MYPQITPLTKHLWCHSSNFQHTASQIIIIIYLFNIFCTLNTTGKGVVVLKKSYCIKYQLFLNDLYYFNSVELLQYSMTKTYLEDIDFLLTPEKQIRYNKRQDRLYLDIDWGSMSVDDYIVIDCHRILDPASYTGVYNDSFLKRYLTALIKRQWGQNLIKFNGVKLPGGIELNGRQLYDDAEREIDEIQARMSMDYELPPLDFIG